MSGLNALMRVLAVKSVKVFDTKKFNYEGHEEREALKY
jgi:hypothetical protein